MNYLIVCNSGGKHYLMMTKNNESGQHNIQGYESKKEVMNAFGGYTKAWTDGLERSASACLGMMNMDPIAIQAPEDIETGLKPYILKMRLVQVSGGALGRGYTGLPVSEDILKLKEFEIWGESLKEAGLKE